MKGRDRILKALSHKEPDYLPIDIGGLDVDTLMAGPYRRLCEYLKIDPHPIFMADIMEQTVVINDTVPDHLGGWYGYANHLALRHTGGGC
jgi:uroporphyrinogen decarboxylase